jgi:hypothetical protein
MSPLLPSSSIPIVLLTHRLVRAHESLIAPFDSPALCP